MTIRFTQTVEDYMAMEHRKTKASMRLQRQFALIAVGFGLFGSNIVFSRLQSSLSLSPTAWQMLLLVLIHALLWYFFMNRFVRFMTRKTYRESVGLLGETELEVTSDGLVQRRGDQEIKTTWDKIGTVKAEGSHTFIDTGYNTTYIIPHNRLSSGNYTGFMQVFAQQIETYTRTAPFPTDALTISLPPNAVESSESLSLRQR